MIGSQLKSERLSDTCTNWTYYVKVARVQVLLCVVHNDAVVSRKAMSVVLVVDVRIAVMLPVSQVHSSKAQMR